MKLVSIENPLYDLNFCRCLVELKLENKKYTIARKSGPVMSNKR